MQSTSVREAIETYGTTAIANAMGIGVSTIHDWKEADAIPGKKQGQRDFRANAFWAAVKRLARENGKKRAA